MDCWDCFQAYGGMIRGHVEKKLYPRKEIDSVIWVQIHPATGCLFIRANTLRKDTGPFFMLPQLWINCRIDCDMQLWIGNQPRRMKNSETWTERLENLFHVEHFFYMNSLKKCCWFYINLCSYNQITSEIGALLCHRIPRRIFVRSWNQSFSLLIDWLQKLDRVWPTIFPTAW